MDHALRPEKCCADQGKQYEDAGATHDDNHDSGIPESDLARSACGRAYEPVQKHDEPQREEKAQNPQVRWQRGVFQRGRAIVLRVKPAEREDSHQEMEHELATR